jgi:hypothetical protein
LRALASKLGAGLLAGIAGTAAITVSSTLEMRLRGRPPSRAPRDVAERVLGVEAKGDGVLLATVAHGATGIGLGVVGGLAGGSARTYLALGMLPELVLVPALSDVEPPWRWSADEHAISLIHHAAYAMAAGGVFSAASRG